MSGKAKAKTTHRILYTIEIFIFKEQAWIETSKW